MMAVMKVLVIRCGALGDLVYATSVIDALKREFGEATIIDFICTPGSGSLFLKDPRVRKIYPLKHNKIPLFLSKQKRDIVSASRDEPYDLLINFEWGKQFQSLLKAIVATKKSGALIDTITFNEHHVHMVDIVKAFFEPLVSPAIFKTSYPRLVGSSVDQIRASYSLKTPYLILSPSNSHQKKNTLNYRAWENEKWKLLIEQLNDRIQLVVIGSLGEDDFFNLLRPFPSGVIDLVGKTPLSDLIGVIEGAEGLVATDTGTAHIASAVNTEVFALIGPTPAEMTGPYQSPNNRVHIISANLECSPCYKTDMMKNCQDNLCMKAIRVEDVRMQIQMAGII